MPAVNVVEVNGAALTLDALDELARFRTALNASLARSDPPVNREWARSEMNMGNALNRKRRLVANSDDGQVFGLAGVTLEMTGGNRRVGEIHLEVHPDHSWNKVGGPLMVAAAAVLADENRTSVVPWSIRNEASLAFWSWLEMPEVAVDRLSRLAVDQVDRDLIDRWRSGSLAQANGYRLAGWQGSCPPELMPALVAAQQGMRDAPMDELEMDHPAMDETWTRAREATLHDKDAELRVLLALDPTGEPAGMTEVILADYHPWFVEQQGTTTLRAHRNQGVGRWLKAEMFEQLLEDGGDIRVIETGNANSNGPMLAINTEMGFTLHVELTTRQTSLTQLQQTLKRLGLG